MTGAPAGALASHPTFDVVCDVSCILTNAEEGARGKVHFRSWLFGDILTGGPARPVLPRKPTSKQNGLSVDKMAVIARVELCVPTRAQPSTAMQLGGTVNGQGTVDHIGPRRSVA